MNEGRVNLLPETWLRRVENGRQARRWVPIWLAVALMLALGQVGMDHRGRQAEDALRILGERTAPLQVAEQQRAALQTERMRLQGILRRQAALEQPNVPLVLMQAVVQSCHALDGRLRLDSYQMEESALAATPSDAKRTVAAKRLILAGAAESDVDVSRFVDLLRESGVFESVDLIASQSAGGQEAVVRSFQLRCDATLAPVAL